MTPPAVLDYTLQRVRSVLALATRSKQATFPYRDSANALAYIESRFQAFDAQLASIPLEADGKTVTIFCETIVREVANALQAIGFISNSNGTNCPFEFHSPFAAITCKALAKQTGLLISADWEFSPYTVIYPNQLGDKFVMVGLPASEADNPLILPLAGHELGHNIWRFQHSLQKQIGSQITDEINSLVRGKYRTEVREIFDIEETLIDEPDLLSPWLTAHPWAIAQTEEVFCDLIGLNMFGDAYLHAFEYIISPGSSYRSPRYPSMKDRVGYLVRAANLLGIAVPSGYFAHMPEPEATSNPVEELLLSLSDSASAKIVDDLIPAVTDFCVKRNIRFPVQASDRSLIDSAFRRRMPAVNVGSMADILIAGWNIYLSERPVWNFEESPGIIDRTRRIAILRELILKNFEIFMTEQLMSSDK